MSGYFEKGRWIENRETQVPNPYDINLRERQIRESREMLEKSIDDTLIREYKRLMAIEYNVQRAGFKQRLWYLITGKL